MNLLTFRNGNSPFFVQNERLASSVDFVRIVCAKKYIVSLISPFLQLHRQRKMTTRLFLHDIHLAKVVLLGMSFLRPIQYARIKHENTKYENRLHVFFNANSRG